MKWLLYLLILCNFSLNAQSSRQTIEQILSSADIQINGNRSWDIQVHNEELYNRILRDQTLGLGEAYVEGWWDVNSLDECFFRILRTELEKQLKPSWKLIWMYVKAKLFNQQTKSSSKKVIDLHYQLGNDLYEVMLDPLMTYSCGYWKNAHTLDEAQRAKYDLIARKLGLKSGMRVLDIGCGWGGFAKFIAEKYGVSVVGITLSSNQAEYAQKMCAGLPVEIRIQDYREIDEKFDRIVEIGMFEHVGVKNYRPFMEVVHKCLQDDGLVMLHTIGSNKSQIATDLWIDRYVFMGGHLPSITQIGAAIEGLFVMEDWHNFGADYDKTLMAWYANFSNNWFKIKNNYSESFYRMWRYYLLSCAGSFRARHIQLWQVVLSKKGIIHGYTRVQ